MPDWTGNKTSVYANLAASSHSEQEREQNDYYATPPSAVEELLKRESFNKYVLEPAVGGGSIAEVLKSHGHIVQSMDIVDRGYEGTEVRDFLQTSKNDLICSPDIVTNPPYSIATEFVEHALDISMDSVKVAMLLKIQFLETKKRLALFRKYPPKFIYVFTNRIACAKNGNFNGESSAVCYAWFVWKKGSISEPIVRWIGDTSASKKLF